MYIVQCTWPVQTLWWLLCAYTHCILFYTLSPTFLSLSHFLPITPSLSLPPFSLLSQICIKSFTQLSHTNAATVIIAILSMALLIAFKILNKYHKKRSPWFLTLVGSGILASKSEVDNPCSWTTSCSGFGTYIQCTMLRCFVMGWFKLSQLSCLGSSVSRCTA